MRLNSAFASVAGATALLCSGPAFAEPDQVWAGVFASGTPADGSKLLLWFDGHARFREGADDLDVSIVRPGLGWRFDGGADVYVGYARVTQHRESGDVAEDRLWQQAIYPLGAIGGATLSGRTRLEQRWRETGDDAGWRLRQFVRLGKPIQGTDFSLVLWDEVFFGLNETDWGQTHGYDQNRLFAGFAWHARDSVRLEGGYLNQDINSVRDERRNNIALNLFVTF